MKNFIDESVEACLTTTDTNVIEGYMKLLVLCLDNAKGDHKDALCEAIEEVEQHLFHILYDL